MSNPVLTNETAQKFAQAENSLEAMTMTGVALKTVFLLMVLLCTATITFTSALKGFADKTMLLMNVGIFGGLITALVIMFSKNAKLLAPLSILYSALEGLALGGISAYFGARYGASLVLNAVVATFGALLSMLFLYSARIIKCTEKFMATVVAATFAILIIYIVSFIVNLVKPGAGSILMGNGAVGIGFSAIVCVIAALNFIIDFHTIENAKNMNLSKDFEWYGSFSLMVTIIWLYVEILRLLAKLNSRR